MEFTRKSGVSGTESSKRNAEASPTTVMRDNGYGRVSNYGPLDEYIWDGLSEAAREKIRQSYGTNTVTAK